MTVTPTDITPTDVDPNRSAPAAGGKASSAPIMGSAAEPTVFELSSPGRAAWSFPTTGVPEWSAEEMIPADALRYAGGGEGPRGPWPRCPSGTWWPT
jgi:hypothetical protein